MVLLVVLILVVVGTSIVVSVDEVEKQGECVMDWKGESGEYCAANAIGAGVAVVILTNLLVAPRRFIIMVLGEYYKI